KQINNMTEINNGQAADIKKSEGVIAKLRDANLDFEERHKVLTLENAEQQKQIEMLKNKLTNSETEVADLKKSIANQKLHVEGLTKDNETLALDLADIQGRYEKLNGKYSEANIRAEEFEYKLKAEVANADERLELKDSRILQLEKAVEVLTKEAATFSYTSDEALLAMKDEEDLPQVLCRKKKTKQSGTSSKVN
ncbi:MAG: hypothetical protein AAGA76_11885, partial [Pseudomonadota bacterium]